jgi:KipI family sensor histidine kinase inhibitor
MTVSASSAPFPDSPAVLPLGDAAWTIVFGDDITERNSALALGFCASLSKQAGQGPFKGILEWAPAFASVTVYVDPTQIDTNIFPQALQGLARQAAALSVQGRQWRIPVCFESDCAPDLQSLAQACGLSPEAVVQGMTQSIFTVRMLGFLPGFPYMDGLPPELSQPRLSQPRQAVPARSIAVAGRMCAAYPWVSPGGWHLLGRTPVPLFDLNRDNSPALLAPGDQVQWDAVSIDAYRDMERDFARADWDCATLLQNAAEKPGSSNSLGLRFRPVQRQETSHASSTPDGTPPTSTAKVITGAASAQTGHLEVLDPAWAVSVQDDGRQGWRFLGVPLSGAADTRALAAANLLLDNDSKAAALELLGSGLILRVTAGPVRCALAADGFLLRTDNRGRSERLPAWRGVTVQVGDTVQACLDSDKPAYLAFSGGLDLPEVLGSRSTYARAQLGGVQGRSLQAGDVLPCSRTGLDAVRHDTQAPALHDRAADTRALQCDSTEPAADSDGVVTLRTILGPQQLHFTSEAINDFFGSCYQVGSDADRMGLRLQGPALDHSDKGADIVTDGVVPGAIQVPANGQPIILMQDAQTTGGYAKIAVVILADLPRLGRLQPGDRVRFEQVSLSQAQQARVAEQQALDDWRASMRTVAAAGQIDEEALRSHNLISGVSSGVTDPATRNSTSFF